MPKSRLDALLFSRALSPSREQARRLIMAGQVTVNGALMDKPGMMIREDAQLAVTALPRFVSRGGEKLDAALGRFGLDVASLICADVGASTGGFADCLLQRGAAKVYAIDVGHGILAWKLRNDPRVVVMEKTNARYVERLPERIGLVTIDASFISLKLLLPVVKNWLNPSPLTPFPPGEGPAVRAIITLIKPQFEAGRKEVGKGGVVRDPEVHRRVLHGILDFASDEGLAVKGLMPSPLVGPKGNVEFLAWYGLGGDSTNWIADVEAALSEAAARNREAIPT
ncbi:MAG: TlyA family RNA methyltransferase [Chloroflexi bacterium]|nr:TlyA family RNA methyltransferase [Chloroflexota bacterium]